MKKYLSLVLVMSFLCQCFFFDISSSAKEISGYSENEFLLLQALDIIDFDISNEDALNTKVTRGEFAVSAAKSMGIAEEKNISKTRYFKDISPMDRSAGYIHALYERGVVKGNGMAEFRPNDNITPKDAATIMLRVAGYHNIYQDEAELSKVAARYGLTTGLSGDSLTNGQMTELIYKVLMMPMPTMNGISINPETSESTVSYEINDEKNTVLYENFKCYEIEGILSAADEISVNGESIDENRVVVDNVLYSGNPDGAYDLIGYDVIAYAKEIQSDLHEIILVVDSGRNKVTKINLEELSPVSADLRLNYYDDNAEKAKTIQLPANALVIKNGEAVRENVSNAFNGGQGRAVIVDNGTGYIAKIYTYDSVLVSAVNKADNMIYTKYGKAIETENINLKRMKIYMTDGSEGSLDSLQSGMFLTVFRSGSCVEIYVSGSVAEGTVTAVSNGKITVGDTVYDIEPAYESVVKKKIAVGAFGTFFFNIYDELAYYDATTAFTGSYGVLVNAFTEELFGATLKMKIFTSDGKMLTAEATDKPKVDGTRLDPKEAYDALVNAGGGIVSQLVTYKLDAEGKISEVDTVAPNADGKGLFIRKGSLGEVTKRRNYDTSSGAVMMLPDIVMKKGAPIFQVPKFEDAKSADDKKFKIIKTLVDENDYDCIAYASDNESFYTDALVMEREDDMTSFSQLDQPFMVVEVAEVLDEEENLRKELVIGGAISQKGGSDMGLMSFMVIEDYELTESDVEVDDPQNPGVPVMPEDLGEGDIIRIVMNQDNEIVKIKQIFDFDDPSDSMLNIKKKAPQTAGNGRWVAGYAVKKADNYVAMSTVAPNGPITEFAYFHGSNVAPVIVMDETLRENRIYVGSYADVITYEETGSVASIVIPSTFYGHARSFFVYRYGR